MKYRWIGRFLNQRVAQKSHATITSHTEMKSRMRLIDMINKMLIANLRWLMSFVVVQEKPVRENTISFISKWTNLEYTRVYQPKRPGCMGMKDPGLPDRNTRVFWNSLNCLLGRKRVQLLINYSLI
ncbi:hypothetical protein D0T87_00785 [Bacteroides sp. 51]|nr:hypothetical protein [Bacteroides sp. 51]